MTKYILHGGRTRLKCESNDNFFREFFQIDKEPVKILLCYFSRDDEKLAALAEEDNLRLKRLSEGRHFETEVAIPNSFLGQLQKCDVLYIRGGDTEKLLNKLKPFNLKNLLKEKIVVASSAGVYALSTYYYDYSVDQIFEGLGVIPVKVSCHFDKDDHQKIVEDLRKHKEELEIIVLPETEYIILGDN